MKWCVERKMTLTTTNVYGLCNKNQWFTCGSIRQYEKMFDYVRSECINVKDINKIKKLATMIWICSADDFSEEGIFEELLVAATINE